MITQYVITCDIFYFEFLWWLERAKLSDMVTREPLYGVLMLVKENRMIRRYSYGNMWVIMSYTPVFAKVDERNKYNNIQMMK